MKHKITPVHLCTRTLVFSSPNNFLLQAWHDKDSKMKTIPFVGAIEVLYVISPIASCNGKKSDKKPPYHPFLQHRNKYREKIEVSNTSKHLWVHPPYPPSICQVQWYKIKPN